LKAYQFWAPKESKCGKEENCAAMRLLLQTIWSIQSFSWVTDLCVSHHPNYITGGVPVRPKIRYQTLQSQSSCTDL